MNMGWIFAVICILIMFWSVEVRFKEMHKKLDELKAIADKSIDKASVIEKQVEGWKKFLA